MEKIFQVFWGRKLIGYMVSPTFDMFDHYGDWQPVSGDALEGFVSLIEGGDDATVEFGEVDGRFWRQGSVAFVPDDEISIRCYPTPLE
jgi:hypothetical protein